MYTLSDAHMLLLKEAYKELGSVAMPLCRAGGRRQKITLSTQPKYSTKPPSTKMLTLKSIARFVIAVPSRAQYVPPSSELLVCVCNEKGSTAHTLYSRAHTRRRSCCSQPASQPQRMGGSGPNPASLPASWRALLPAQVPASRLIHTRLGSSALFTPQVHLPTLGAAAARCSPTLCWSTRAGTPRPKTNRAASLRAR